MKIRLTPNPIFTKEVPVNLRGVEASVQAIFTFRAVEAKRAMSLLVLTRLLEKNWFVRMWEWLKLCLRLRKVATGLDVLDQMIISWDESDSGFDMPYSKEALLLLLAKDPSMIVHIPLAYFAGMQEEKLKN